MTGAEFERLYDRAIARMRRDPEKRKALDRAVFILLDLAVAEKKEIDKPQKS